MSPVILIVKTSSLGDILHTFPALERLRVAFPEALFDWVVEEPFAELVRTHEAVRNVHTIRTKVWRRHLFSATTRKEIVTFWRKLRRIEYDVTIDWQGNCKSGLVTGAAKSGQKIGFDYRGAPEKMNRLFVNRGVRTDPSSPIRERYIALADAYIEMAGGRPGEKSVRTAPPRPRHELPLSPHIMICVGSHWKNKRLSQEVWLSFLQRIDTTLSPRFSFVWSNAEEREQATLLARAFPGNGHVPEKMDLTPLRAFMDETDIVLSVDSMALHLAGTTRARTYGIFGPSSAYVYNPEGGGCFQGSCPYGVRFVKRCPRLRRCRTGACTKEIDPEKLFRKFMDWYIGRKQR
ncbi:MAG: lipopolysaccharide heptosyltransferase I [Simkaniaceae bacterium]|nr:lipopolysaccharide heptosyltransferase I [Simkaniaceae bacterium]